jgi:hypothetical protein
MPDAMTLTNRPRARKRRGRAGFGFAASCCVAAGLAGCGGGGTNPLDNPASVNNTTITAGQKLAFAYFQECIDPIFQTPITTNGATNTCAASGCHDNTNGTGGAFRVVRNATKIDLSNPANTPDVIRASDMYKNFYSAQGSTIIGSTTQSRLLNKPMLRGVLHGGGLIFDNPQDLATVKRIEYWINRPPTSGNEFDSATYTMFTPADPATGTCNTQ